MIQIVKEPTAKQLRTGGLLLALFMGLIGAIAYFRFEARTAGYVLGGLGAALAVVYYAAPATRRPIYIGWLYAVYPIGWTVSHLIVLVVFYGVVTPVGLVMRLLGKDPMARGFDRAATSYWVERDSPPDRGRYFRQF